MHISTPLIRSLQDEIRLAPLMEQPTQRPPHICLKMESAQPSGSFKLRGIGRLCESLVAQGARRLISSSGGNAGYSAAWCARLLGVDIDIYVPRSTSPEVVTQMRALGAQVQICGESWDAAHAVALQAAEARDAALVHPFDHPLIWEGHASLVHELAEQGARPELIILSVGGGGLLSGVALGLQQVGWTDVQLMAVETEGAASLAAAQKRGAPVTLERIETVAGTLGARRVCAQAMDVLERFSVRCVQLSDREALLGCEQFLATHRVRVEPACGVSYKALEYVPRLFPEVQHVVVVVCGGIAAPPA